MIQNIWKTRYIWTVQHPGALPHTTSSSAVVSYRNVRFSRRCRWYFQPSGMLCCLVGRVFRDVSNDRTLLIFRVMLNLSPNCTASLARKLESSMFQFLRGNSRSNFWSVLSIFDCCRRHLNRRLDLDHWRWTGKGLAGGRCAVVGRWLRWTIANHEGL